MWKVVQVGLGPLGRRIASDLHERRLGEVVEAVDVSAEVAGRDLAALVPGAPPLRVRGALRDVARWDVDCAIVTTSSRLPACADTFRALLERGLAVVSTCEELSWPYLAHAGLAAELHALAVRTGGRLLGTGVNPGYLMDALPLFLTAPCRSVRRVGIHRVQDATPRRGPFQHKIGAGLEPSELAARLRSKDMGHVGLPESLHFVAASLGWTLDDWSEESEPVVATRELQSALGPVMPGRAAGVRQVARGFVRGEAVVTLEFVAALGQEDPHDRVVVDGDPPMDVRIAGGVHGDTATCALVLNAIPALARAAPGLHTMATLPVPRFVRTPEGLRA